MYKTQKLVQEKIIFSDATKNNIIQKFFQVGRVILKATFITLQNLTFVGGYGGYRLLTKKW